MKNSILAISAAPAAIPVKPNIAATIAITRKRNDHRNIYTDLVNNTFAKENSVPKMPFLFLLMWHRIGRIATRAAIMKQRTGVGGGV